MTLFYTAYLINHWKEVLTYQFDLMDKSNLLEKLSKINIFAYPKNYEIYDFLSKYENISNKVIVKFQENNNYEIPALNSMICEPDEINLYLHSKTTSKNKTDKNFYNVTQWMKYMSYYVLSNWKLCIDELNNGADAVGVDFKSWPFTHYSGNFWWTTRKHINDCKNFKFSMESIGKLAILKYTIRHTAEMFIGSSIGKYVCLNQSNCDWYHNTLPEKSWKIEKTIYIKQNIY